MSILTQLLHGQITFAQAAQKAEQWASAIVSKDSTLTSAANGILSDVKQGASNAIDMADSALGSAIIPASTAVEAALDAALAKATGGVTLPFNPLINDGIDRIANAIKAEADAWSLKAKAALASPSAPTSAAVAAVASAPQSQAAA